ncbi:DUF6461 domain-containing protein [Kitasatospora sp. LaBMicrA B282]|uniref:DUF6461 domain-containing protein n=1 Tax=Kitasatospora sp. LaBMicrA B282 TaxID=3420949 RepID=UPI003D1262C1
MVDGEVRVHFEPPFPDQRDGSRPDELLGAMVAAGFDLDPEASNVDHHTAAAFALAEHVTGVRVTAELLDTAEFTHALVPNPGR